MTTPDSREVDLALKATLEADATLSGLLPDGWFFDNAAHGAQNFGIISLVEEVDEDLMTEPGTSGTAFEDALYAVKAVTLGTGAVTAAAAAARLHVILQDQQLTNPGYSPSDVPGYYWMTVHREKRIRYSEVDDADPSIRWQHQGGYYRVQMGIE